MNSEKLFGESERSPELRLFSVENFSDDQLIVLWRSLASSASEFYNKPTGNHLLPTRDRPSQGPNTLLEIADGLYKSLAAEIGDIAAREPERVKRLVGDSARSEIALDREFAAQVAPYLVPIDYEFARDVLVALIVRQGEGDSGLNYTELFQSRFD